MISEKTSRRMMHFDTNPLEKNQPRDDRLEVLELFLLLGRTPPRGAKFRAPGPVQHPRWLSKLFYTLKIWMFRKQFSLVA